MQKIFQSFFLSRFQGDGSILGNFVCRLREILGSVIGSSGIDKAHCSRCVSFHYVTSQLFKEKRSQTITSFMLIVISPRMTVAC